MASRVQRLCAEIGWFSMENIIKQFKPQLVYETNLQDCKEILFLPNCSMNPRLADSLRQLGMKTCQDIVMNKLTPEILANKLQLMSGFSIQVCSSSI